MGDGERTSPAMEATMLVGERSLTALEKEGPDPLVGRRLKHFEVQKPLGRGGMGAVYLGRDTSLERQVAIKVLDAALAHDPEVLARFVREARAQARLRHPNVAQIYFIGEDAGTHFFVMEYLEGPALDALLASGRPLPWAEALEYALCAARGLRAAIAEGFVHRDVKPSNLMRDRESGIKILDFGLVKSLKGDGELTRDGAIVGSPLYMAPEQGRGEDVDHRTDIYSLGCALYHMLTGRPPFQAPSPVGIIAMHVTDKAAPMRTIVPDLPDAAEKIVARMMAKRPSDRFRDYDHLIAALEAARPDVSMRAGLRERALALAIDLAPIVAAAVLVGPWALLVAGVYFVVNHRLSGRTIGKMLMRLRVTDFEGKPIDWKTALIRFGVFAWGVLAWGLLAGVIYLVHRHDRVSFTIAHLTGRQLALPLLYGGLAALVFMAYLGGFLLVVFHPQRRALHDVVARTEVRRTPRR